MAIGADESSSRLMQRVESCSQLLRQVLAGKDYIFNGISMSTDDIPRGLSSPDISVYKYIHMYIYMHVDDIPVSVDRRWVPQVEPLGSTGSASCLEVQGSGFEPPAVV